MARTKYTGKKSDSKASAPARKCRKAPDCNNYFDTLPDELLSVIFSKFSTTVKKEMVQRVCLRFRRLLAHPAAKETWGHISIDWLPHGPDELDFLPWLLQRSKGIQKVQVDLFGFQCNCGAIPALVQALAGALAPRHVQLGLAASQYSLKSAWWPAKALPALGAVLVTLELSLRFFNVRRGDLATLCSLSSLQELQLDMSSGSTFSAFLQGDDSDADTVVADAIADAGGAGNQAGGGQTEASRAVNPDFHLTSLRLLHVSFCHNQRVIEGLLPDAKLLPHLSDLVLKGCQVGPKVPGVVAGLTSLERLSLKSSVFGGGLPSLSSLSRLTFCNLSYCTIDDFRPTLQGLSSLAELRCRGLRSMESCHFSAGVAQLAGLKVLDLKHIAWHTCAWDLGVLRERLDAAGLRFFVAIRD